MNIVRSTNGLHARRHFLPAMRAAADVTGVQLAPSRLSHLVSDGERHSIGDMRGPLCRRTGGRHICCSAIEVMTVFGAGGGALCVGVVYGARGCAVGREWCALPVSDDDAGFGVCRLVTGTAAVMCRR